MKKFADLHIHTTLSDSTLTPKNVVKIASEKNIKAIGITDHDSVEALTPCIEEAKKFDIEVIPGVELTAEEDNMEIHVLGYFFNWKSEWFARKLEKIRAARLERIYAMLEKLKKLGIKLEPEKVFDVTSPGAVGRLHLAMALYNEGFTSSIGDAFRKYIGERGPCYVKKYKLTPKEAIGIILKLNGVPVLAHPNILGRDDIIPNFVKDGLRGIEVYHSDHPPQIALHYEELAARYNLLMTGGSDCHGTGKGRVLLGDIKIPYELVEKLKAEADRIRNSNNEV